MGEAMSEAAKIEQRGDTTLYIWPFKKGCFRIAVRETKEGLVISSSARDLLYHPRDRGTLVIPKPDGGSDGGSDG